MKQAVKNLEQPTIDLATTPGRIGFSPLTQTVETVLQQQRPQRTLIDVRAPSEFLKGHIPGARNVPLLDDEERAEVGTTYRISGARPRSQRD